MMDRRVFIRCLAASGALLGLDPESLLAATEGKPSRLLERRKLGRTDLTVSVLGFGGMTVASETPENAANYIAEVIDRGVNYFDVAPYYGKAQKRFGPVLKSYRNRIVLSCKTLGRTADACKKEMRVSFRDLKTDYFDLYQLHALNKVEEVETVFGPGGAMEVIQEAKKAGKIRYLGITVHSEAAALAALDRYDFDTIMMPLSVATWHQEKFGPAMHAKACARSMGILGIKTSAHQKWASPEIRAQSKWKELWYQPFVNSAEVALCLRHACNLPVHSILPPGNWELVKMALDIVQSQAMTPLSETELASLKKMALTQVPMFTNT